MSITVLLSVFNGQKYLEAQLKSLELQIGVEFQIIIRDDGSKDNSLDLIKDWMRVTNLKVFVIEGNNIGLIKSFNDCLHYCIENNVVSDYYAFCDQDDVWLPEKLMVASKSMSKLSGSTKLYFSNYTVVDENLKFGEEVNKKYNLTLQEALVSISTLGCTQVFTRDLLISCNALLNSINSMDNEAMPNHDGWMYLCALSMKAEIVADSKSYILYRQHSDNVVGALKSNFASRFKRLVLNRGSKRRIAEILSNHFDSEVINMHKNYRDNLKVKIRLLRNTRNLTTSKFSNLAYKILLLTNYY